MDRINGLILGTTPEHDEEIRMQNIQIFDETEVTPDYIGEQSDESDTTLRGSPPRTPSPTVSEGEESHMTSRDLMNREISRQTREIVEGVHHPFGFTLAPSWTIPVSESFQLMERTRHMALEQLAQININARECHREECEGVCQESERHLPTHPSPSPSGSDTDPEMPELEQPEAQKESLWFKVQSDEFRKEYNDLNTQRKDIQAKLDNFYSQTRRSPSDDELDREVDAYMNWKYDPIRIEEQVRSLPSYYDPNWRADPLFAPDETDLIRTGPDGQLHVECCLTSHEIAHSSQKHTSDTPRTGLSTKTGEPLRRKAKRRRRHRKRPKPYNSHPTPIRYKPPEDDLDETNL